VNAAAPRRAETAGTAVLAPQEPASPPGPAVAYVFEGGGQPQTVLENDLRRLRHAIALDTLDTLDLLRASGDLDRVVLVTDRRALADEARSTVTVHDSAPAGSGFHFGRALAHLLAAERPGLALVLGGAAAPLLASEDLRRFLVLARANPGAVVQNNPQSPDIVAFSPAAPAAALALPDSDNALGQVLGAAGYRRVLVENSARINFDIDTPSDAAVLAGESGAGPRARRVCADLPWLGPIRRRLELVDTLLGAEGRELALFGRVGPPVTGYLNMHLRCRLRVFSEERGMRALGRVAAGSVVSFLGRLCDAVGPGPFFAALAGCADAALFDTRVLMAHWRQPLSDADRYHSDVGAAEAISDPTLAAFTAAAWSAEPPVVLGGHTLVYGGLWLLADRAIRRLHPVPL
jgi:CTP:molybdopterin cytidylyltransferase MocA